MVIFGSGSIVSTFMQHGLIDEYRIIVNPIVLGNGNPLFKGINGKQNLKLLKTKVFDSGIVILFPRACTSIFLVSVSKRIIDSSDPAIVIHKLGYTHNDRVERHVECLKEFNIKEIREYFAENETEINESR